MIDPFKLARVIGKVIEEKARKVLDCEYQIRTVVELIRPRWMQWYGLEAWKCKRCHLGYFYSINHHAWLCGCNRGQVL